MDYRGLTVKIGADDTQLGVALGKIKKEAKNIDAELKQVNRSLKFDPTNVEALAKKQELYNKKIKNTQEQLAKMREGLKNASAQKIDDTQVQKLKANIKECERNIESYRRTVKQLGSDQAFAKQEEQIRKCNQEIVKQESKIKTIDGLLEQLPNDSQLLAAKQREVYGALQQSLQKSKVLEASYKELSKDNLGRDKWLKLQLEIKQANTEVNKYSRELKEINAAKLNNFVSGWKNVNSSIRNVGTTLTGTLTPAVTVGMGALIAAATQVDSALTGVRKTVDGTADEYAKLKEAAIEFSLTNAVSASEIMNIQMFGAQLGYAIDELDMFGQVVSGLDIATNMDANTAASELAQFANITKMSHDETENYGAAIVGLGNNFATTESDISHMAMRLAAAGTQVGMSQADILGLATAMSSLGVEAEAGGSALSTIMSKIDKAVATGGESLSTWASAAQMSAAQFAQAWKDDPVAALQAVLGGIGSMSEAGGNMNLILDNLGIKELRQIDSMKRMAQNSELVGAAVAKSNEEWQKCTALTDEVANRNESLAAKFEMVKNRLLAIADKLGAPLADAFLAALDAAEPLFQALETGAQAFADMSTEQQQLILGLVGLAAAAGPTLSTLGAVSDVVAKLIQGSGNLANKFNGITSKLEGVTSKLGGLKGALSGLSGGIVGVAAAIGAMAIGSLVSEFMSYQELCQNAADASMDLETAIKEAGASVKETAEDVKSYTESFEAVRDETRELTKAQAEFNKGIVDQFSDLDSQSAVVDGLAKKIADLTTRYDENGNKAMLSAEEQTELTTAVQAYNEVTGSSIDVLNASIGLLSESTSAINDNAAAWEANAKKQAAQEAITEEYKNQIKLQQQIKKTEEEIQNQLQDYGASDRIRELNTQLDELNAQDQAASENIAYLNGVYLEAESTLESVNKKHQDEAEALDNTSEAAEGAADSTTELTEEEQEAAEAAEKAAEEFEKFCEELQELVDANGGLRKSMDEGGYSLEDLAKAMQDAGLEVSDLESSIDDLASKSTNAFEQIEQASVVSIDEMLANLAKNREATAEWSNNIKALYDRAGDDVIQSAFVKNMASLGPEYADQLQALVDATPEKFDAMAVLWYDGQIKAGEQALEATGVTRNRLLAEVEQTSTELSAEAGKATESITGKYSGALAQMAQSGQESSVIIKDELKNQQDSFDDLSDTAEETCANTGYVSIEEAEAIGAASAEIVEANEQAAESAQVAAEEYQALCDELEQFADNNALFAAILDDSGYALPDFAAALQAAKVDVQDFETEIGKLAESTQNAFDVLEQQETISLDEMISNLQQNQASVNEWRENMITLWQMAGDDVRSAGFVEALAQMGPEYSDQLQLIIDGGQEKFDELAQAWGNGANVAVSSAAEAFDVGHDKIVNSVDLTFSALANALQDQGLNISDLATMGAEQFSALAESLGLSVEDMTAVCAGLDINLDGKITDAVDTSIAELERIKESEDIPTDSFTSISESAGTMSETTQEHVSTMADGTIATMETMADDLSTSAKTAYENVSQSFSDMQTDVISSTRELHNGVINALTPLPTELQLLGVNTGVRFAQGILAQETVTGTCAETVANAALTSFQAIEDDARSAGTISGNKFGGAILDGEPVASMAGNVVANAALSALQAIEDKARSAGTIAGNKFGGGILDGQSPASVAGGVIANAALAAMNISDSAYTSGTHAGGNFAAGIASQASQVSAAAARLAQAAKDNIGHTKPKKGPLKSGEEIFGKHLAQNFAKGISSSESISWVSRSSNALAQTVVDYIGHSQPKKGALKDGEWVYGQHAAINFAEGLYDGRDKVKEAASSLASSAADELSATEERFNQMVASYVRNVDEIKGTSTSLVVAIREMQNAADDEGLASPAYAATKAYSDMDKIVQAGYKSVSEFRQASKDFAKEDTEWRQKAASNTEKYNSDMEAAHTKYTDTVSKNQKKLDDLEEKGWEKKAELQEKFKQADQAYWEAKFKLDSNTDAKKVESLTKALEKANTAWYKAKDNLDHVWDDWYKLEAENKESDAKALEEMNKTQKELTEDYRKSTMAMNAEYAAFTMEYNEYQKLQQSLTTSLNDLEASESLYKVTSDIVGSISGSNGLNAVLQELGTKGVQYTQAFVDAMVNGGEEYIDALGDMSTMTAEQLQSFVDSFESAEIAEREAALAARALYVEYGKQSTTTKSAQRIWLEYRETVMDVKEAMNGDAGLAKAFAHAGTSVEGLAADVMSLGMTMDDVAANAQSWSEKVSNGFSALSSAEKTGATDYVRTLKNNMAETQQYTANVQTVFSKLTDTALEETEAFRKAVIEGGYEQYAGIMADMATMNSDQIMEVIRTYNDSLDQGLQDSIAQFQALAPGEELMIATIDGMKAKEDVFCDTAKTSTHAAAEASLSLKPEFYSVGQQLASGIGSGIMAQAQSIANAAASTVRQAIAAAKAEADIHSPSRKMRDEVGLMLGKGIAVGVDDSNKYVRESMDNLIGQPFMRESQTIDSRAYTTNTTVNINMGGVTVRSDNDIKKLAKQINREQQWAMKGMGM